MGSIPWRTHGVRPHVILDYIEDFDAINCLVDMTWTSVPFNITTKIRFGDRSHIDSWYEAGVHCPISINNFGNFTCADSFKQTHATHEYITSVLIFRYTAGHRTRSAKHTCILWSGPTTFEPNCDGWWQPSWIEVVEIMGNMDDKRLLRGSNGSIFAITNFHVYKCLEFLPAREKIRSHFGYAIVPICYYLFLLCSSNYTINAVTVSTTIMNLDVICICCAHNRPHYGRPHSPFRTSYID